MCYALISSCLVAFYLWVPLCLLSLIWTFAIADVYVMLLSAANDFIAVSVFFVGIFLCISHHGACDIYRLYSCSIITDVFHAFLYVHIFCIVFIAVVLVWSTKMLIYTVLFSMIFCLNFVMLDDQIFLHWHVDQKICNTQGFYRSGKTGKSRGIFVVRESQGNVKGKYYFWKVREKSGKMILDHADCR